MKSSHRIVACGSEPSGNGSVMLPSPAARAGAYLAARYGLGVFVSVGNMLVMTWWIGPHAYGLFVTAIGLAAFLSSLARAGVDTYLVRIEPSPHDSVYHVAGTVVLAVSLVLTLGGVALAPFLVRWYGSSEFVRPYLVLLLTIPLTGLTGIPMAKLEGELNFRSVAGIELGGQALGLLLAAILAWAGLGVWAPVAGQIGWQAFVLVATFAAARLLPQLRFDRREAWEMLSFGFGLTASLRTWQLRTLVNPLLVGRFAGVEGVAFVALAIRIAEALGTFRLAAGRMAVAALSRLRNRNDEFCGTLERALFLQVITLGPLLCAFALLGPFMVPHLMGVRWMPSLAIYPFVAAGVLVNSIYNLQASALFVIGRPWIVMRSFLGHVTLLGLGTLLFLPRFGITGYGWAELLACGPYLLIHAGLAQTVTIGYRKLVPWLLIFLALIFLPMLNRSWAVGLSAAFLATMAAWTWKRTSASSTSGVACKRPLRQTA